MMKTSFAFLAHPEHLDSILSYHLRKAAERNGFDVVKSYPLMTKLSDQKIKAKDLDQSAKKDAWRNRRQLIDKNAVKEAKAKKKVKSEDADVLESFSVDPVSWGNRDLGGADFVFKVDIQSFSSDATYIGVFGWMSAVVSVYDTKSLENGAVFADRVKGYGWGYGISPIECYALALNMPYWSVLGGIEKSLRSSQCVDAFNRKKTMLREERSSAGSSIHQEEILGVEEAPIQDVLP